MPSLLIFTHIYIYITLWLLCLHALTGKEELLCLAASSKHATNSEATKWSGCIMRAGMVRRAGSGLASRITCLCYWKHLEAAMCLFRKGTQHYSANKSHPEDL